MLDNIDNIKKIIFYKKDNEEKRVKVLYNNSDEVNDISFESGMKLCQEITKRKNIKTKDGFRELINSGFITITSEEKEKEKQPKQENTTIEPKEETKDKDEDLRDDYIYSTTYRPVKKKKGVKNVVITATAIALVAGIGIYFLASRKSPIGNMNSGNTTSISDTNPTNNQENENEKEFKELIDKTKEEKQRNSMINSFEAIKGYNGRFSNAYIEDGKDVKPALTFEEITALQIAYNDYSKDDIKKIYNGAELDANKLYNDYKSASLQLMGAYAIETKENPLDMSVLIESEDGKAFYKKYQQLFMKAKYATGKEQIEAVKAFYKAVREDFPITKEVRTEGIAHSDSYNSIESYKLAVTPMIAAAEMMFQNLEIDETLNNEEIDFLNDIGLCNYAQNKFNKVETILLSSDRDNNNPSYEDFKNTIIKIMKKNNEYVIDDKHRDLSKLDTFKLAVSGRFNEVINGNFRCTVVQTYSTTTTTYREEVETKNLPITDEAKKQVDDQIASENAEAKRQGEQAAERNREQMQSEADREADRVNSEVERDNQDMQQRIDDANNSSKPVNESDFGNHGVDFDDNHSDSNGNLDDSVSNITTDGTGDQTNEDLPDPNQTGKKFDSAPTGAQPEETEGYQYTR